MGKSRKRSNAQRLVADDKKSRPNDDGGTSGPSNSEPAPAQVSEQQQVPRAPSFPVASSTLQNWIKQVHTSSGRLQARQFSTSRAEEWVVYQFIDSPLSLVISTAGFHAIHLDGKHVAVNHNSLPESPLKTKDDLTVIMHGFSSLKLCGGIQQGGYGITIEWKDWEAVHEPMGAPCVIRAYGKSNTRARATQTSRSPSCRIIANKCQIVCSPDVSELVAPRCSECEALHWNVVPLTEPSSQNAEDTRNVAGGLRMRLH